MDEIILFLKDRKNLVNLLTLIILVLGLPIGVNLARHQQVISSQASNAGPNTNNDGSVGLIIDDTVVVSRNNKVYIVQQPTKTTVGVKLSSNFVGLASAQSNLADKIVPPVSAYAYPDTQGCPMNADGSAGASQECSIGPDTGHKYCKYVANGPNTFTGCIIEACACGGTSNRQPDQDTCNKCQAQPAAPSAPSAPSAPQEPAPPQAPGAPAPQPSVSQAPSYQPLNVSCSAGSQRVNFGQAVTWNVSVSGGSGSNTISWGGDTPIQNTNSRSQRVTYTDSGDKTATVTVTDNNSAVSPASNISCGTVTVGITTLQYKLVVSDPVHYQQDLTNAQAQDYTPDMVINQDFVGTKNTPGIKYIYAAFLTSDGKTHNADPVRVIMVPPDPQISQVSCDYDITQSTVAVNIKGSNFGTEQPTVQITRPNQASVDVNSNDDGSITGVLSDIPSNVNQDMTVSVARGIDGQTVTSTCHFGLSQIVVHSSQACLTAGGLNNGQGLDNVELIVVDNTPGSQPTTQSVSIDAKGVVSGLTTPFQKDHTYKIGIKAPRSLRRVQKFTAGGKSTSISFSKSLPLGDISPSSGDDAINSFDYQELKSEWGTGGSSRLGDLNGDGVVNSLDWACMKQFFGQSSDPIPAPDSSGVTTSSPLPSPSLSPSPSSSVSPSP